MPLDPKLAKIKRNLPAVAKSQGFNARVTSGYRTKAAQTKLYKRYLQGLQQYPVAVPGTSDHEKGKALDVVSTDTAKLVALLTAAGLSWAGPSDPVHFSMIGPQIAKKAQKPKTLVQNIGIGKVKFDLTPEEYQYFLSLPVAVQNRILGKATGVEKIIKDAFYGAARSLVKILF